MKELRILMQKQFDLMCQTGMLFTSIIKGNELWEEYLKSFSPENNPIFRDPNSTSHNCNLCNNFIRRYGNVISVSPTGEIMTLFDFNIEGEYKNTVEKLSSLIKSYDVQDVFFEDFSELNSMNYSKCKIKDDFFKLGLSENHKVYTKEEIALYDSQLLFEQGKVVTFNHFCLDLPAKFVNKNLNKSKESLIAFYRDKKTVFKRCLNEINLDTLNLVSDLIKQKSLLDGESHLNSIESVITIKKSFDSINIVNDTFYWVNTYHLEERIAKFKNTLIGVLCTELAEGLELNTACKNWNKRVDPVNYMKATAPITKNQIKQAEEFVVENGYSESFNRRLANLDDINVSEIRHINDSSTKEASLFSNVLSTKTTSQHKRSQFDDCLNVNIEEFMSNILPNSSKIELFLENRMTSNFVNLTTGVNKKSKNIFKWDNDFSWDFNGNLAGKSMIKENVKLAGGKVDGDLRFSIQWADDNDDNSDLDAYCILPDYDLIAYNNRLNVKSGGNLDVDIRQPLGKLAVENITFPSIDKMSDGKYKFVVHQFSARNSRGFTAEIEFNGEIFNYEYNKPVGSHMKINVATIDLKNKVFSIEHHLDSSQNFRKIYNLETNEFQKVNLVCLSPNHWGNNNIGNKHYLFMLNNCKNEFKVRSFHNENLNAELSKHRKVLEVLGSQSLIESNDDQLAGLGFNATVNDSFIVKVSGSHNRVIKINI